MKKPKVTICTVHFSAAGGYDLKPHIEPFFASLKAQTYEHVEIFCLDNASTDEAAKAMLSKIPGVTTMFLPANRGTCAYNAIFPLATGEYFWIATMDTRYEPDFLEKLVAEAERHPDGGSFGGALLSLRAGKERAVVDSLGTSINRWQSVWDRDQGKEYVASNYAPVEDVFGLSGATVLFRRKALQDIALANGDIWDETYFMYYEDVDVSFRLQWQGWKAYVVHSARGFHVRTLVEKHVRGGKIVRVLLGRFGKSDFYKFYANRNKILLLLRNWNPDFSFGVHLRTCLELIGRLAFVLLFEPASRRGVLEAWRLRRTIEQPTYRPHRKIAAERVEHFMR
ncbi:hypothetical protein COW46_04840 [Candidatus Gracilibacteria bacterium CG17_big_fil_post_rev_8_21_14_2_50_48_13]|nr:MAG: hypothetical protein COW46_04840 [Candidatus Gracilibacteria bacterium CG17_big_fil_post_rev_8_21_14_2_50_48_13]